MSATKSAWAEPATEGKQPLASVLIPAILIMLPVAIFYGVLFHFITDLPALDDYDAVLGFLNRIVQVKGTTAKFGALLAAQHNEYKLFFGHGVEWGQVGLLGHVNFTQLCVLGDIAVLALALILWSMFIPGRKDLSKRLAFFVPVAWLLFQLQYWETLDWAMASLQNLWVIVFSLGAIRCLLRPSRKAYAGALLLYALAVAASGNGFLLLPVGVLILAMRRRLVRASGWLAASAVCIAAYAYRYNTISSQSPSHGSVFATLFHLRPDYAIAFVGNAGAIGGAGSSTIGAGISIGLGTVLLLTFAWLARRGYCRRNPDVSCCVLFLLLTAVGAAGMRSDFGLEQSLSSRYAIYGVLLLICAWMAVVEEFLQHRNDMLLNNGPYLAAAAAAILFSLCMDEIGGLNLARRQHQLVMGMAAFQRQPEADDGPVPPFAHETADLTLFRARAHAILRESIRLGVYEPPKF